MDIRFKNVLHSAQLVFEHHWHPDMIYITYLCEIKNKSKYKLLLICITCNIKCFYVFCYLKSIKKNNVYHFMLTQHIIDIMETHQFFLLAGHYASLTQYGPILNNKQKEWIFFIAEGA
jgi:hypothetical protein